MDLPQDMFIEHGMINDLQIGSLLRYLKRRESGPLRPCSWKFAMTVVSYRL